MSVTIEFHNMTGDAPIADYLVEVSVNRHVIAFGRVDNHNREDGWQTLVRRYLDALPPSVARGRIPSDPHT